MVRSFMMLLMLIIVFLTGMLFGVEKNGHTSNLEVTEQTNQDQKESSSEADQKKDETKETEEEDETSDLKEKTNENDKDSEPPQGMEQHLTQKTASFLEKGVVSFYNFVVEIMYQLSSIFF